jgi:hypothetical protein
LAAIWVNGDPPKLAGFGAACRLRRALAAALPRQPARVLGRLSEVERMLAFRDRLRAYDAPTGRACCYVDSASARDETF